MTDYTFSTVVSASPGPSRSPSGGATSRAPRAASAAGASRALPIRAKYDAAQTNAENLKLWSLADDLSARVANSPEVRQTLRKRARYEVANNSYAKGIVETLANDLIGTGPRLQMMSGDAGLDARIVDTFEAWTAEVGLAEKLRTMKKARTVDGEAFAAFITNPRLRGPVKLDLQLIETDQVTSMTSDFTQLFDPLMSDGIRFDRAGNPVEYTILKEHPGGEFVTRYGEATVTPAELVLHWFRVDRPGQVRGIPDITPALHLFGLLRRYTLAVLAAAETAADFAAVLESEMPPDDGDAPEPMDTLQIERRVMLALPGGMKLAQLRAEQPTTTYEMFKNALLNEIARCLNMPFNVAAGNSAGYNYASGRLDHQTYYKSIYVDQYHLETAVLDRLFAAWVEEARLATDLIPRGFELAGRAHQWMWDGTEHVDPQKEASAQETRLRNHTTTLARECARQGHDWEEMLRQRAREEALMRDLGLSRPDAAAPGATPPNDPGDDADGDDE